MANTVKVRRSATPSAVPTTVQLALGEIAVNTYDGKMFIKKDVSGTQSIVEISGGGGGTITQAIAGDSGTDNVTLGTDTLTFVGGTGITSAITNNTVTFDIDSTVATLTGTETLTNKTLTSPTLTTPVLGTPTSGNFSTGTFTWPTFNQNTTGSSATLTTARNINGTSFNGSTDITTANWGTARTITIGATGKSVNGSAAVSWTLDELQAEYRQPNNTLRNNLGDPTAREMALFHGQFNNKFRFIPATTQEESTDGTTWTTSTRATANQLADIMLGEGQAGGITAIPTGTVGTFGAYRLTWDVVGTVGYVYLNNLYFYNSASGNTITALVEAFHNTTGWTTITGPHTFGNWPGHTTIPHSTIPYSSSASQYGKVRVTFTSTHNTNTNSFDLYGVEWFGGYPAGRRNVESYDRLKNVTFPAAITATSQLNSTTAVITPNASGVSTGLTVANGDITTYRTGGTTGVVYFNTTGTRYLYWDATNYNMPGGAVVATNITAAGNVTGTATNITGTVAVLNGGTGVTTSTGTGSVVLSASPTFTGTIGAANLTLSGDLIVNGTTTTINSTTLSVDDINIELGSVASPTDVTAAGGGITLKGATDKTINWGATNGWTSSEDLNVASGKIYRIAGTSVLSATTLGSGVTGSSLTSVGTIGTGTWQGTIIGPTYGGTGVNNGSNTITLAGNVSHAGAFTQTFTATANTSITLPTTGTLVTLNGTETLTNKTLTSPTLTTPALGTPASGNFSTGTFTWPTFNQSTSGNAATATSAGNLTGGSISGNYTLNNATSPNTVYLQFGDNTGWTYRFMTSVAGTPTTRFSFVDSGNFTAVGTVAGTNITTGGNVTGTATGLSATLVATSGGTGQSTYAIGDLLQGGATNTLTKLAAVATGNVLLSGGVTTVSAWGKVGLTTHVSGTLPIANGGTNLTTYTTGDIVYASATNTLASLADIATGNALISGGVGVAPSYGKIGLTTHISGTLPVGNGGTGLTTLTANYIPYGNGTSALQSSASLTFNGSGLGVGAAATTILDVTATGGMMRINGASGNNLIQAQTGATVGLGLWAGGNSRLYSSGALTLSVNSTITTSVPTGYVDAVTILSSGNMGVGTASPGYKLEVNGAFAATTKSFVIDHPTKPNMKLRYGSLEGPENGVYVRGRLTGTTIELPDYWVGLVHEDSITVSLTPIGKHQKLYVKDIVDNTVVIGNENIFGKTECFYTVFAERKDVDKLEVEI